MKIAIYVFVGVLAAVIVAYLLSELLAYIRRANRAIKNSKLTPYDSNDWRADRPYSSYTPPWYRNPNEPPWSSYNVHFDKIELNLRNLSDKVDILVEDMAELMVAKETEDE